MKKVINIILLVVIGVSLSGCKWFEHENSNKNKKVEIVSLGTELLTYGAEGYIVLCDSFKVCEYEKKIDNRWLVIDSIVYHGESDENIRIEINVDSLNYGSFNYIEIIVNGVDTIPYGVGTGEKLETGEKCFSDDFEYNGKRYAMEGVFKLDTESDILFIDFVHRDDDKVQSEIRDKNWVKEILTSSQIDEIVYGEDSKRYSKTYITLSWVPNALPRECYNIGGKMYTKSMMGDRWIYLANQYPPLGYMVNTNETHMIAYVTLKNKGEEGGNGFKDKYKVVPFKLDGCINNKVLRKDL